MSLLNKVKVAYSPFGALGNRICSWRKLPKKEPLAVPFLAMVASKYYLPCITILNFDGPESDEVRPFFLESALHWAGEYQIDALRLDALHALVDLSPKPFLAELAAIAHRARERGPRKF